MHFLEKTVCITGAAGGLGKALCLQFGREGARIAALDIDPEGLSQLAQSLASLGVSCEVACCDLTDEKAVYEAITSLAKASGGIDLLINNAGTTHLGLDAHTDTASLHRVMDINFWGSVYTSRAAFPYLQQARGKVVVISSVAGFAPLVGRTAYAASKHALHGYFETLRTEWVQEGIQVLMVCPASITTGIRRKSMKLTDEAGNLMEHTTGRSLEPEEAAAIIFRAVIREKRLVLLGFPAKASWWLKKLFPRWYDRLMLKRMGKAIFAMR